MPIMTEALPVRGAPCWVNLLVRDIANPSLDDTYFPTVRTFDWFRMQNIADTGPDANGVYTDCVSAVNDVLHPRRGSRSVIG